ncbi:MAG: hypothetical protein H9535_20650 [Ignavibacteria bacterium]|nr:hypothetical protein [Ignavibacteria bacterium]
MQKLLLSKNTAQQMPFGVAIGTTMSAAMVLCLLLSLPSSQIMAQPSKSSAHPHLKASALHEHAHKHAHTKISPCEQEAKNESASHLGQTIISDKVPCPGNSMGIESEPHLDPKVLMSKLTHPPTLKSAKKEAWVSLMVLVDEKGKLDRHMLECVKAFNPKNTKWDAELSIEEIEALEANAIAALQSVTFEPAQREGKPLQCWTRIPIHYRLP